MHGRHRETDAVVHHVVKTCGVSVCREHCFPQYLIRYGLGALSQGTLRTTPCPIRRPSDLLAYLLVRPSSLWPPSHDTPGPAQNDWHLIMLVLSIRGNTSTLVKDAEGWWYSRRRKACEIGGLRADRRALQGAHGTGVLLLLVLLFCCVAWWVRGEQVVLS